MSYLVASSYVTAHALQQGYRARGSHHTHVRKFMKICRKCVTCTTQREARCEDEMSPSGAVVETLVWQGLASVVIPGYTINRVCALSHLLLVRQRMLRHQLGSPVLRRWTVTAVGLGCIPLIIQPIDRCVCVCVCVCVCARACISSLELCAILM